MLRNSFPRGEQIAIRSNTKDNLKRIHLKQMDAAVKLLNLLDLTFKAG